MPATILEEPEGEELLPATTEIATHGPLTMEQYRQWGPSEAEVKERLQEELAAFVAADMFDWRARLEVESSPNLGNLEPTSWWLVD